ncbi:MAG TPA: sigma-54-dependent Fis family transcriptional regulator [Thiotrichaceae bacterium]|jgi:DNA-binding NtrC family response regulator|nr:sigma-54-dependent Fis family transcriptional regulator [Thiotrichaceae bacterium]HIM08526.1 sigma-54-dependent Fis family transcriptional regulator [Gammaproteobacteria bacterium]
MPVSEEKPLLLFVDDDPIIVDALSIVLAKDFEVITAESRKQVKSLLQDLSVKPALALVDLGLPPKPHSPEEGFKLIEELMAVNNSFKILILSGQNEDINIHHALTLGAVDFISKPCDMSLLVSRLEYQMTMLQAESSEKELILNETKLLGESVGLKTLRDLISQFADTAFPVLVEGESGTGKELVAEELHSSSSRSELPFITINCAAFTPELLEAQLFGYIKGAFTGASNDRVGFFEAAGEGSLFLDEVSELPLSLQSKLLRVLENGEFYRIGETKPRLSKARIIAATNRDLKEEIRAGTFRQDLYHRLCVLVIHVPELREREHDALILMEYFKGMYAAGNPLFELTDDAKLLLEQYSFPGNIRELRNIAIRLSAKYSGKPVSVTALQDELESDFDIDVINLDENDFVAQELKDKNFNLDNKISEWERRYVSYALKKCNGNLSKAARLLGVNRTTLYSRLQRLNIESSSSE